MNEIFISYSRQDLDFVRKLKETLNQAGIDPWIDFEDIWPIAKWEEEILIAVQSCHDFIFVISPDSCHSRYCELELIEALKHNKRIIPIKTQDINTSLVPLPLRGIQWIDFLNFQEGLNRLLWVLNAPYGISQQRLDAKIEIQSYQEFRGFYLYRDSYLIGRFPQTSILANGIIFVKDPSVSRTHLFLKLDNRWQALSGYLDGMNYYPPRNGAYLNKKLMAARKWYPLRHGDTIQLSAQSSIKYLEMNPESPEEEGDDKETYTGEN